ncbi:MAG: LysR family transcriptional regulator [Chlamydiales bacterium]|nr:LysR family transcriptional regulator [Chlamydiales bacterium]
MYDKLATFVTVIEEGSFANAARKLHISAAAVSKQIRLLEEELKIELMVRSTRSLSLTDAGHLYFEQAKKIVQEMHQLTALNQELQQEPSGILHVSSARYFGETYIVPRLPEFLEKYPKLTLSLELMERLPDIDREDIDIVIGMSRPLSLDSIQKTIGHTKYVFTASPAYLKTFGTPHHPHDLKNHRYINHSSRVPTNITYFKDNQEVYLEPSLLLNDTNAMKQCALNGLGIVKLHEYVVADAIKEGTLVEILSAFTDPKEPIFAAYKSQKHLPTKIRKFLDFFTAKGTG